MKTFWKRVLSCALIMFVCAAASMTKPGMAQSDDALNRPSGAQQFRLDPAELETFLDGLVGGRLEANNIAGATISIVHNGAVVLSKGYGYADAAERTPVDGNTTLFRIGSVSKTFIWTAVMQLAEQGKIDLNEDIRTYLKSAELDLAFEKPITMLDLMGHAPGFEESIMGHFGFGTPDKALLLSEYANQHQPEQVREPGRTIAYSNYGVVLAGLIVADISGMPFEEYIEKNIYTPLAMTHSSFREDWGNRVPLEPLDQRLVALRSKGHIVKGGMVKPAAPITISHLGPAGSMAASARDMARFMLAHLQDGRLDTGQILKPETAQLMHTGHLSMDDNMPGLAHGFIEYTVAGYPAYGHGGDAIFFLTDMKMIPDLDLGIFISTNTTTGWKLAGGLAELVVERFFPVEDQPVPVSKPIDEIEDIAQYAGSYLGSRRAYTSLQKLLFLPMTSLTIAAGEEGYLISDGPLGPDKHVAVAPGTFRSIKDGALLKFTKDSGGDDIAIFGKTATTIYQKVGIFETFIFLYGTLGICALFLIAVIFNNIFRRVHGARIEAKPTTRLARYVTLSGATVWALAVVFLMIGVAQVLGDIDSVVFRFPPSGLKMAVTLSLLGTVLTVVCAVLLVPVWRDGDWSFWLRVRHTTVVAAMVAITLVLFNLNAIGHNYY